MPPDHEMLESLDNLKKLPGKRKPPSLPNNENGNLKLNIPPIVREILLIFNTLLFSATKSPVKLKKPLNKTPKKRQSSSTSSEKGCGHLTFPIVLNDELTLHCVGEVSQSRYILIPFLYRVSVYVSFVYLSM